MKFNLKAIFLSLLLIISFAFNASAEKVKISQGQDQFTFNQTEAMEKDVLQNALKFQGFGATQVIPSNMTCGFAPFPPLGCKNPRCICEVQNGQQVCRWVFQCS